MKGSENIFSEITVNIPKTQSKDTTLSTVRETCQFINKRRKLKISSDGL